MADGRGGEPGWRKLCSRVTDTCRSHKVQVSLDAKVAFQSRSTFDFIRLFFDFSSTVSSVTTANKVGRDR